MSGLHGGPAESGANDREVVQETQAYGGINPYVHQTDQIAGRGLDIRPYSKGIDTGCVVCVFRSFVQLAPTANQCKS
jgi:ATP-dependent helicase/DNAse subunit B